MGALIMAHSDDEGLVLPPKLAPIHVVIVPIFRNEEELNKDYCRSRSNHESASQFGFAVKFDNRDTQKPGFKFAEWELKGVPVRLAIGPRDLENGTVEVARSDTKEKETLKLQEMAGEIPKLLDDIQENMFQKALEVQKKSDHRSKFLR